MKKILILFIPMFFLAGCQTIPQGWVLTGQSRPDQTPSWFMAADPSSIRVNGQTATMTTMMSYSSPQNTERYKNGYRIELASTEYKCGERLSRILKVDLYESKEVIVDSKKNPSEYTTIRPSSIGEVGYELACKDVRVSASNQQKLSPQTRNNQPVTYYDFQIAEWAGNCAAIYTYGAGYYRRSGNALKAKQFSDGAQKFFNFTPYKQTIPNYQSHFKTSYDINIGTPKLSLDIANMANSPQIFTDYLDREVNKCNNFVATLAKQRRK